MIDLLKRHSDALCILNGCSIALVYFSFKQLGVGGGLDLFVIGASMLSLFGLFYAGSSVARGFLCLSLVWRGVVAGLTQVLICYALMTSSTSAALLAGLVGTIVGVGLGRLILKERVSGIALIGVCVSLIGAVASGDWMQITWSAALGGFLQGVNATLTRNYIQSFKFSVLVSVSMGYAALSALLLGLLLSKFGAMPAAVGFPALPSIISMTLLLAFVQYGSCIIYYVTDSQRSGALGLVRIPFALILEVSYLHRVPERSMIWGGLLVLCGAILVLIERRRNRSPGSTGSP